MVVVAVPARSAVSAGVWAQGRKAHAKLLFVRKAKSAASGMLLECRLGCWEAERRSYWLQAAR
jgi:hypothetical protein